MKRYALFTGENYYPNGGAWDFKCFGDTIEELKARADTSEDNWAHIAEVATMNIVLKCTGVTRYKWVDPEEQDKRNRRRYRKAVKSWKRKNSKLAIPVATRVHALKLHIVKTHSKDRMAAINVAKLTGEPVEFQDGKKGKRRAYPSGLVEVI